MRYYITNFRFADDIILLCDEMEVLEGMVNDLDRAALSTGLRMDISKTKIMAKRICRTK